MVAKFSPGLLRLRQICLGRFLLLPATRVIELKDIRYTSKWKTTSQSNAFQKNPKAGYRAEKELARKSCLSGISRLWFRAVVAIDWKMWPRIWM